MRVTLALALLLASCQSASWTGAADLLMPDEFTMGQGSSSMSTVGGYAGHNDMFEYDGDGETTYAALTWSLPSVGGDESGMDRRTQRNLALLVDHMATEEGLIEDGEPEVVDPEAPTALTLNLRPGVAPPPKEILFGILIAAVLGFLLIRYKATASRRRQW